MQQKPELQNYKLHLHMNNNIQASTISEMKLTAYTKSSTVHSENTRTLIITMFTNVF